MSNSRKVYINDIVRCNNKEVPVQALIDTGNTVKAKSVMVFSHRGSSDPNCKERFWVD